MGFFVGCLIASIATIILVTPVRTSEQSTSEKRDIPQVSGDPDELELGLIPNTDQLVKRLGDHVFLQCYLAYQVQAEVNMKWFHGDTEITAVSGRVRIVSAPGRGWNLFIEGIRDEDAGLYTCTADSGDNGGHIWVNLLIMEYVRIDSAPSPQVFKAGQEGLIECLVSGNPPPIVRWYAKDSSGLWWTLYEGLNEEVFTKKENGLLVYNMRPENNREYKCVAGYPYLWEVVAETRIIEVVVEE